MNPLSRCTMQAVGIGLVLMINLSGCSSNRTVTIETEPTGVRVTADGKSIGETPVTIVTDEAFPPRWIGSSYMVKGTLGLDKPGCESVSMPVDDAALSQDVHVVMKCEPGTVSPANASPDRSDSTPASSSSKQVTPNAQSTTSTGTIEQRLKALKGLLEKDLITQDEYDEIRTRILNSL